VSAPEAEPRQRCRLPVWTLTFVTCAIVVELAPTSAMWLGFERAAVARGQLWRLLTGHLVHGSAQVALLDLAAFALFGLWVERTSPRILAAVLAASAITSTLAVFLFTEYERYVGSSALVSGLLVATAILMLRDSRTRAVRVVALTLVALFAAKVALEWTGLWPAALGGLPPGHETAVVAHVGGALGGGTALLHRTRRR